ncbi:outer membrane beta-barrel protein [Polaribacter reichenbachii]|uniref:outer membrane beta-barrel protein n=1 Tax=Polaribacter reichenbachii TaxID=996801 RepID=UPI001111E02B|nr:outer membrane beta-barrel protein [Polaribacter reichenbachii]
METTTSNSVTNNQSFLDLSFLFNDKLDFELKSESYYFDNLESENSYYFLDFDLRYKLINYKITLGLTGKNIFNTKKFRNYSISDIDATTTEYRLLPRLILLKMEFRF